MVRWSRKLPIAAAAVALLLCLAVSAAAQRGRFFYGWDETVKNVPYDGRFTFVRVRYTPAPGGYWAGGRPSWVHGYPIAEQNLMRIMKEISFLDAHVDISVREHQRMTERYQLGCLLGRRDSGDARNFERIPFRIAR